MKKTAVIPQKMPYSLTVEDWELVIPSIQDAGALYALFQKNKTYVGRFLNRAVVMENESDIQGYIQDIQEKFTCLDSAHYVLKKDGQIFGMMEVTKLNWKHGFAEFGYFLNEGHTKSGYISKSLKVLEKILFDMGFERLVIGADVENIPSQNVALRAGYEYEGTKRRGYFSVMSETYKDIKMFAKLKS